MRPEEIQEKGVYEGGGAIYARVVDFIFDVGGRQRVAWYTPQTMSVKRRDGSIIHTPHGTCLLDTFARWARKRIGTEE